MTMGGRGGGHRHHRVSEGVGSHVTRLDLADVGCDVTVSGHIVAALQRVPLQGVHVAHPPVPLHGGRVAHSPIRFHCGGATQPSVSLKQCIALFWPRQLLDSSWWQ